MNQNLSTCRGRWVWVDDTDQSFDTSPISPIPMIFEPTDYIPSWLLTSDDESAIDPLLLSGSPDDWLFDGFNPEISTGLTESTHQSPPGQDGSSSTATCYKRQIGQEDVAATSSPPKRCRRTSYEGCSQEKDVAGMVDDDVVPLDITTTVREASITRRYRKARPGPRRDSKRPQVRAATPAPSLKDASQSPEPADRRRGRTSHNEIEKKYRSRLNGQFDVLLEALGVHQSDDGISAEHCARLYSKAEVLAMATRRIRSLETSTKANRAALERLRSNISHTECPRHSYMPTLSQWVAVP